jgi:hypothetical protein
MVSHPLPSFAGPSRHRYPHGQFAHDLRVIWRWLRFGLPPLTPVQWAALVKAEKESEAEIGPNLASKEE